MSRQRPLVTVRTILAVLATLIAVGGAAIIAPVLLIELDDGYTIPHVSDAPELPEGVTVIDDQRNCGSGGCWQELTLRGPQNQSHSKLAASLNFPQDAWNCEARSLFDRRQLCTSARIGPDGVKIFMHYQRWLDH